MNQIIFPAEDMVFVFGSNLQGRHGKGAALHAKTWLGAEHGVAVGPTGRCYAIPTKKVPDYDPDSIIPIDGIREYVNDFINYAKANPDKKFMVTRIGCGLSGYKDTEIEALFRDAPENCFLPGLWMKIRNPKLVRMIIAGGRDYPVSLVKKGIDYINWKTERLFREGYDIVEVSGKAKGADALGEFWAATKGVSVTAFDAPWNKYGKAAGYIRNSQMAWYGTHLITFWDSKSRGTKNMIDIAKENNIASSVPVKYTSVSKDMQVGQFEPFSFYPNSNLKAMMERYGIEDVMPSLEAKPSI